MTTQPNGDRQMRDAIALLHRELDATVIDDAHGLHDLPRQLLGCRRGPREPGYEQPSWVIPWVMRTADTLARLHDWTDTEHADLDSIRPTRHDERNAS